MREENELSEELKAFREECFRILWGQYRLRALVPGTEGLEDAFEDGRPCEWFYDNIYRTKRRILERGGFEAELEYICRQYEYIAQYVANRMFDAGVRAARREMQPDAD